MHTPYYLLEESLLRRNLALIRDVADRSGAEIILAFKAFALWKTFPIFREYIRHTTASSPDEARLAFEEFGSHAHTYSPAYTEHDFSTILRCSSHIIFNSLSQYRRFAPLVHQWVPSSSSSSPLPSSSSSPLPSSSSSPLPPAPSSSSSPSPVTSVGCHAYSREHHPSPSLGLRVNPEYSEIETELYNPCAPGSRFGVLAEDLPAPADLPSDIQGFHIHCHCESSAEAFARTLVHIINKFSPWFPRLRWINFGGGHLMTRQDYNVELLVQTLRDFHSRWPHLQMILEPGSAFAWQTGPLVASVVDIVENHGIRTAILDVSFTCHMPDCLEMPYHPSVKVKYARPWSLSNCGGGKPLSRSTFGRFDTSKNSPRRGEDSVSAEQQGATFDSEPLPAELITSGNAALPPTGGDGEGPGESSGEGSGEGPLYRLGGNSCLSGDFMGTWRFPRPLSVGDEIIFEDMIHYTTVKTTTFNGVHHPSIVLQHLDGTREILREYTYEDYKNRMD